ncbi:MAG TPA: ATP-binding protein, partial [Ilumatobacteraceae bacterium]|nr:ATP-binding protein [Ilumatobacteraceae bacterium]
MATLGSRVAGRDRELFVARTEELAFFDHVLAGASPVRIIHVHGPGGIGKSALLRELSRRATSCGYDTVWLDGRDLPPFPAEVEAALRTVTETWPAVVLFDSYEMISSLDSHLRDTVIPQLPDTTVVVFASRQPASKGWFEHGWDSVVHTIELGGLTAADAKQLLHAHGVLADEAADTLVHRSHGSPLALVVGAETGSGGSIGNLVDRLVGDEVDPAHYRILSVASLARVTTPELLGDVLGDAEAQDNYKWLATRSFSEPLAAGVTLHSLVAEAVRERIRTHDP